MPTIWKRVEVEENGVTASKWVKTLDLYRYQEESNIRSWAPIVPKEMTENGWEDKNE